MHKGGAHVHGRRANDSGARGLSLMGRICSKADVTKLAGAGLNSSQLEQVENESCSF